MGDVEMREWQGHRVSVAEYESLRGMHLELKTGDIVYLSGGPVEIVAEPIFHEPAFTGVDAISEITREMSRG